MSSLWLSFRGRPLPSALLHIEAELAIAIHHDTPLAFAFAVAVLGLDHALLARQQKRIAPYREGEALGTSVEMRRVRQLDDGAAIQLQRLARRSGDRFRLAVDVQAGGFGSFQRPVKGSLGLNRFTGHGEKQGNQG